MIRSADGRPPYAQELVNCIDRCPMEGKHTVLIHITHSKNIELTPGDHKWGEPYHVSNLEFSDITYKVEEYTVHESESFFSWLHAFFFGPPDIQTVIMSFEVNQSQSKTV